MVLETPYRFTYRTRAVGVSGEITRTRDQQRKEQI
jgi:hypothetical protein